MQIELKKTKDWHSFEWSSYVQNFNKVFDKNFSIPFFMNKYLNTIDGFSYHALLKTDQEIVGACTVIPYNYSIKNQIVPIGLVVDVFILAEYRTDPLVLYRMYKKLKKELVKNNIALVVAVPNDTAYPYWKNIVKWKDIGCLNYYALPIKLGNIITKLPSFINLFLQWYTSFLIFISSLFNNKQKYYDIKIDRSNPIIYKQRYTTDHYQIKIFNSYFSYRIVNEKGIRTGYIIDFYNILNNKRDNRTLKNAVNYILKNEKIDIIIYVGSISFFQLLLYRIPRKYEPKHLYFMADILDYEKIKDINLVFNIHSWDFGLFNYDVR